MSSKPNDNTPEIFNTRNVFGQLAAPDSTPTAVLYRNGVIDGAVTVTVAQLTTTRFSATYTIPGTYSAGDTLQVIVSWTMGGAADELPLPIYVIDSARLYDITAGTTNARAIVEGYAAGEDPGTLLGTTLSGLQSAVLSLQALASSISTAAYTTDNATPGSVVALPRDPLTGFPLLRLAAGQTDKNLVWQGLPDLTGATNIYVELTKESTGEVIGTYPATATYDAASATWLLVFTDWVTTSATLGRFVARGYATLNTGLVHATDPPIVIQVGR
jgi:hypothetical protein